MKLNIQILTGETFEVEVDEKATIGDVKKEIFRIGMITKAVRILKDSEILSDGSSLVKHHFSDGDTVNIVIEPEKEVEITVNYEYKCSGEMTFKYKVNNTALISEIKKLLVEEKNVVVTDKEFELKMKSGEQELILNDLKLPLHCYGISERAELSIDPTFLTCKVFNQKFCMAKVDLPAGSNIGDLREQLMYLTESKQFTLFTPKDGAGNRVKKMMYDEEKLEEPFEYFKLDNKFTKIAGNIIFDEKQHRIYGIEDGDCIPSIAFRAQDQLGIPGPWISVKVLDPDTNIYKDCSEGDFFEAKNMYKISINKD